MTAPAHVVLERVTLVAPFGLSLWDQTTGTIASDGLAVRLFRLDQEGEPLDWAEASANRRGVFVAHDIPGLADFEARAAGTDVWPASTPPRPYLVEVRDTLGRFTPFTLRVDLPAPLGPALPPCIAGLRLPEPERSSPPAGLGHVPLFSTPSRPIQAGQAVVRATLLDAGSGKPAQYAALEVRMSGQLVGLGIADEQGQVAAVFPYPEPPARPAPLSPPASPPGTQPLTSQTWLVDIVVRYRRGLQRWKLPSTPESMSLAELCEVLLQPDAVALQIATSPPAPLASQELRYGEELLLAAGGGGKVLITPA